MGLGIVVWRFRGGRAVKYVMCSVGKSVVVYGYSNHKYLCIKTFSVIEQFDQSRRLRIQIFDLLLIRSVFTVLHLDHFS